MPREEIARIQTADGNGEVTVERVTYDEPLCYITGADYRITDSHGNTSSADSRAEAIEKASDKAK